MEFAKNTLAAIWDSAKKMAYTTKGFTEENAECVLDAKLDSMDLMDREGDLHNSEETDCNTCHKVGKNQRCSRCQGVWYCSKKCQVEDWRLHKKICKRPTDCNDNLTNIAALDEEEDEGTKGSDQSSKFATGTLYGCCSYCTHRGALKSCGACKKRHYCSKECQKMDWPAHKSECKTSTNGNKPESKSTGTFTIVDSKSPKTSLGPKDVTSQWNIPTGPNTSETFTASKDAWKRARYEVGRKFRDYKIFDTFDKMPADTAYCPGLGNSVGLFFMPRPHFYFPRHCIYIEDIQGHELFIAFYLDYDKPTPYFTWDDVRPGRFICVKNARLRHFLTGGMGVRVDEASYVSFIDIKRQS